MRVFLTLVSLLLALAATGSAQTVYQGHVVFRAFFNSSVANIVDVPFEGTAVLVQTITGGVSSTVVNVTVRGLQANKTYGIHVHQWGDLSGSFDPNTLEMFHTVGTAAGTVGGHFDMWNRNATAHNCAPHATRHTGDLGNISVAITTSPSDWVTYTLTSELLDLGADSIGNNSIIGRAVVIHENPDNCVQTGTILGNWVGVGVIGIDNVENSTASQDAVIPLNQASFAPKANAIIYNITGAIAGNVWFWSDAVGGVHMTGIVQGFEPNSIHAVHIHQFGNVNTNLTIGGHYGAGPNTAHALPPNATRHWGDLGNLKADDRGYIIFTDISAGLELISLSDLSKHSIIGHSIAFHQKQDIGDTSFGDRYHFGVIGLANPAAPAPPAFDPSPNSPPALAHAVLRAYYNSSIANVVDAPIAGTVDFQQNALGGDVSVTIRVSGLQAGKSYGIHVHTWGDLSAAVYPTFPNALKFYTNTTTVSSVGSHFDAYGRNISFHGCSPTSNRHTGDLGNITIPDGTAATTVTTITLTSELLDLGIRSDFLNDSIIGRAVVIHENPDLCVSTGLGAWLAVGVIGLKDVAGTSVTGNSAKQDTLPTNTKANVLVLNATTKAPIGDIQLWTDAGVIRAYGIVGGFAPGSSHGMHVHVWGNEDSAAVSGPHYSQYLNDFGHALPPSATRHWGDLGSVTADALGNIIFNNTDINANLLSLWNATAHGILGRTLTFHALGDDGTPTSYMGRVAYGTVGLANNATVLPALPTYPAGSASSSSSSSSSSSGSIISSSSSSSSGTSSNTNTTSAPSTSSSSSSSTGSGTNTTTPPTVPPTVPPSAATQNQVNVIFMIIAAVMAMAVVA